ncbi:MAG: hypothetical protein Q7S12_01430 [bacterium]|nr:hypothetical protein [bacterium]
MSECKQLYSAAQKKPTKRQRKRLVLDLYGSLKKSIDAYGMGNMPDSVDQCVKELQIAVKDNVISYDELHTSFEEIQRMALKSKTLYYQSAIKEIRNIGSPPWTGHVKAMARAILQGIEKAEISWEDLGANKEEFSDLVRTYPQRWEEKDKRRP